MSRIIRTPWGELRPYVDMAPVWIILVSYGLVYFLPGRLFYMIFHGDDGPIEWAQVLALFVASLASAAALVRRARCRGGAGWISWLVMLVLCLFLLGEEISWGERLFGLVNPALQSVNVQGETNLHNLQGLNSLMHASYVVFGLVLGYVGWRLFPGIPCLPPRELSLYFLPLALFAAYLDLSWISNLERIRNDQEIFEFVAYLGLAVNGFHAARLSK
jgi:hypothetical protein